MAAGIIIVAIIGIAILFYVFSGDQKTQTTKYETGKAIAEAQRMEALAEMKRQAEMNNDNETVKAIMNMTYTGKMPWKNNDGRWANMYLKVMNIKIAGINYRRGIGRLCNNGYKHEGFLMPEPKNPNDPKAIKIMTEDGVHVGYIPAYETDNVREFVNNQFPTKVTIFIQEDEPYYDEYNDREKRQFTGEILLQDPNGCEFV